MAIAQIIPTITQTDPTEYKQDVKDLYPFAKRVHIDVSDGTLTPNTTISESAVWWPRGWTVDLHMITATPSAHLETLLHLHPNLVTFHAEASEDLLPIFEKIKEGGMKVGIAIVKGVYPGNIKTILQNVNHALIFSGDLGKQGGEADLLLLEKVKLIRDINPNIEIGWDGGVNLDNARLIAQAGITAINVGGCIKTATNKQETYEKLLKETESQEII